MPKDYCTMRVASTMVCSKAGEQPLSNFSLTNDPDAPAGAVAFQIVEGQFGRTGYDDPKGESGHVPVDDCLVVVVLAWPAQLGNQDASYRTAPEVETWVPDSIPPPRSGRLYVQTADRSEAEAQQSSIARVFGEAIRQGLLPGFGIYAVPEELESQRAEISLTVLEGEARIVVEGVGEGEGAVVSSVFKLDMPHS